MLFDDGEILDVTRWQKGEQGAEGRIKLARFRAASQSVLASDSPSGTPSTSRRPGPSSLNARRTKSRSGCLRNYRGGTVMMPPDDYGFSKRLGWIADRFGVSWQLNLARRHQTPGRKETSMKIVTSLSFQGYCREAFEFYAKILGGRSPPRYPMAMALPACRSPITGTRPG